MFARTLLADEYVDFLGSGVNTAITAAFALVGSRHQLGDRRVIGVALAVFALVRATGSPAEVGHPAPARGDRGHRGPVR